ncbi:hypothetical protein ZWY2020_039988 [Hordeum vulgare]|nr:hypothetical protein ZWY2020_039988 [Hordeum vulgare]
MLLCHHLALARRSLLAPRALPAPVFNHTRLPHSSRRLTRWTRLPRSLAPPLDQLPCELVPDQAVVHPKQSTTSSPRSCPRNDATAVSSKPRRRRPSGWPHRPNSSPQP